MPVYSHIPLHLKKIQHAIANHFAVQMEYFSPGSGQFGKRTIEPIGTIPYGKLWQVIAFCQLRQDYRTFRLDRMSKVVVLAEDYLPHDQLSLEQYLERQSRAGDTTLVKVSFASSVVASVVPDRYRQGFVREIVTDSGVEMWFMVVQTELFCRWLKMYDRAAVLVSPGNLCTSC